jgi:hypothetical protein
MSTREITRSKLAKKLNKLLYKGEISEVRALIRRYPSLAEKSSPYIAERFTTFYLKLLKGV